MSKLIGKNKRPSSGKLNIDFPRSLTHGFFTLKTDQGLDWPLAGANVTIEKDLLLSLIKSFIAENVRVDESWYRLLYPDIDQAIRDGQFLSAKHHYVEYGYFEDRIPRKWTVDEGYYLAHNKDVDSAIRSGVLQSCQLHFERAGYKEGRHPYEDWNLLSDA